MKIALISEHASPLAVAGGVDSGGQNIYVAHVARQLYRAGHQVDVFTRRDRSLLPLVSEMDGIRIINVPAGPPTQLPKEQLLPYMSAFAEFMMKFISQEREPYHLLHANFFMSGLVALQIKRALGIPVVTTFHALGRVRRIHQGEDDGFPDQRFAIEDDLVRHSDVIVAECPQDRADLIELYRADPERIEIVPCGFDVAELQRVKQSDARDQLGWPRNEFIVLQLGRLVPRKGIDNVIRGVGALRREHGMNARLYVVGGNSELPNDIATPEIARLRSIARDEQVEEQTTFVGRHGRAHLSRFYSAADVFVTTPWYEPFGITPVEAMACGTPVIGADVGGIRYSVRHGETGLLVPPRDPVALAARLAQLQAEPALARRMGRAGAARARTEFTWQGVAQSLEHIYRRVAKLPQKPQADEAHNENTSQGSLAGSSRSAAGGAYG